MDRKEIGKNIRKHREEHKMSQAQLAYRVGVSRSTIQAIEEGRRVPSVKVAQMISLYLGISTDDLIETGPPSDEVRTLKRRLKQAEEEIASFMNSNAFLTQDMMEAKERLGIIEDIFFLKKEELPLVEQYITNLIDKNGGYRSIDKEYNVNAPDSPYDWDELYGIDTPKESDTLKVSKEGFKKSELKGSRKFEDKKTPDDNAGSDKNGSD